MFEFVTVTNPTEQRDPKRQRQIRQHAIKAGIRNKRKAETKRNDNFVAFRFDQTTRESKNNVINPQRTVVVSKQVSSGLLDPFDSLPGDGEQLRVLMAHIPRNAVLAVSSSSEASQVYHEGMNNVFRGALAERPMFQALLLASSLAASNNVPNMECLRQRGETLQSLRLRMANPQLVPAVSTLTAMLLLIGYEYRVDGYKSPSISMHIDAMNNILKLSGSSHTPIATTIWLALLWHDLYSCLFIGTERLLSYNAYSVSSCDQFDDTNPGYLIPVGFQQLIATFPPEFHKIMCDLNALCTMVDARLDSCNPTEEHRIDHFQYSIQSRLVDLLSRNKSQGAEDLIFQACIFAAFLYTYKLSTGMWEGCFIPEYCATQIASLISKTSEDPRWRLEGFEKLFLWLSFVNGALSDRHRVRTRAINAIRDEQLGLLEGAYDDWVAVEQILQTFVCLSPALRERFNVFWQELHAPVRRLMIKEVQGWGMFDQWKGVEDQKGRLVPCHSSSRCLVMRRKALGTTNWAQPFRRLARDSTMAITIEEAWDSDIPRACEMEKAAYGSTNSVLFPGPFPAVNPGENKRVDQIIAMRDNDSGVRLLKAVDEETGEQVAFAKWHIYETSEAAAAAPPRPVPSGPGVNEEGCKAFFGGLGDLKKEKIGATPHLYLHMLHTDPKHQRRGAASALLHWGINKADELGLPVYLESSTEGRGLYAKHGFEVVEMFEVHLGPFGGGDETCSAPIMIRQPARSQS